MSEYKSLQNLAYDHLKEMIYGRDIAFGVIYSETKLATRLNLSRTPVRDALNRLAFERYIDVLPNRGFRLHEPDEADMREAYHVRMMLEGYCGGIIAREIESAAAQCVLKEMETALERQREMVERSSAPDLKQFWIEDQAFHRAMLGYLNISSFNTQFETYMHIFMPQHLLSDVVIERNRSTLPEHQAIIDALKSGGDEAVLDAIRAHLDTSMRLNMMTLKAKNDAGRV